MKTELRIALFVGTFLICLALPLFFKISIAAILPYMFFICGVSQFVSAFRAAPPRFRGGTHWRNACLLQGSGMTAAAFMLTWGHTLPTSLQLAITCAIFVALVCSFVCLRRAKACAA
jgi:hypothetical protein